MKRQVSQDELKAAYGPISEMFEAKLDLTLARLQKGEEIVVKKKMSLATILALAVVMILSVALATVPKETPIALSNPNVGTKFSSITDQVFALDELQEGAELTIYHAHYDDEKLHIAYKIEAKENWLDYDFEISDEEAAAMHEYGFPQSHPGVRQRPDLINARLKEFGRAAVKHESLAFHYTDDIPPGDDALIQVEEDCYVINSTPSDVLVWWDELYSKNGILNGYFTVALPEGLAQKETFKVRLQVAKDTDTYYYVGSDLENCKSYLESLYRGEQEITFEATRKPVASEKTVTQGAAGYIEISMPVLPTRSLPEGVASAREEYVENYLLYMDGEFCEQIDRVFLATGFSATYYWFGPYEEMTLVPIYSETGPAFNEKMVITHVGGGTE